MIETGFEEVRRRAPWPAEAGEKPTDDSFSDLTAGGQDANAATFTTGPETVRFQGMRMGYYCVDKDSTASEVILNQIVTLKEDSGK